MPSTTAALSGYTKAALRRKSTGFSSLRKTLVAAASVADRPSVAMSRSVISLFSSKSIVPQRHQRARRVDYPRPVASNARLGKPAADGDVGKTLQPTESVAAPALTIAFALFGCGMGLSIRREVVA